MRRLNQDEIQEVIREEDECGVNNLLQDLLSSEHEGKELAVFMDEKGNCTVKVADSNEN